VKMVLLDLEGKEGRHGRERFGEQKERMEKKDNKELIKKNYYILIVFQVF